MAWAALRGVVEAVTAPAAATTPETLAKPARAPGCYNAFNQLTSLTGPGGVTEFTYDANGNQTGKSEPVGVTAYTYDARDRLISLEVPPGAVASCAGDADCDGVPDSTDNCPQVANASQANTESFAPNTVSHWHFDEASGTSALDAADGNHGTLAAGVTRVVGRTTSGALSMNGAAGGVQLPASSSLNISNEISIEAWVKRPEFGGGAIVSKDNHYFFGIRADGLLTWADSTDFNTTNFGGHGSVPQNTWTHLVATKSGSTVSLYMNGGLVVTRAWFGGLSGNANAARIGPGFTGTLDEVAIYNRALTGAEIAEHAAAERFGPDALGDACDPCPTDAVVSCGTTTCTDADGDGFGVVGAAGCTGGTALDCDDTAETVHPGAPELANARDDDCDGRKDEGTAAAVLRYGYDTQGLRVRVEDATGTRRVLLDGVEELAEYDAGTGSRTARYDHDVSRIDALLGQVGAGGTKVHAVTDALGSVYGLTDGGGEVVSRYGYDVYGARSASVESVATKWGYTGRVHEAGVAGAMYYRARYLDVTNGVFMEPDRLINSALPDGDVRLRTYWYANANPVVYGDPTGWLFMAREGYYVPPPEVTNQGIAKYSPIPDDDWQLAEEGYKILLFFLTAWPGCDGAVRDLAAEVSCPAQHDMAKQILDKATLYFAEGTFVKNAYGISYHPSDPAVWPKEKWTVAYTDLVRREKAQRAWMASTLLHEAMHAFVESDADGGEERIERVVKACALPSSR